MGFLKMSLPKYLSTRLIEAVSEIVDFKLKQRGVFKNPMKTIMEPQSIKFGVGGDTKGGKNNLSQQEHLPNFDDFWDKCPRKIAKGAARKAYKAALMKATPKEIIFGMERYARSCVGKDPKFICHPSTWLNQERWADVEYTPSPQIRVREREAILRRITALEKERAVRAREFDIPRVREIDEQLDLERCLLKDHAP